MYSCSINIVCMKESVATSSTPCVPVSCFVDPCTTSSNTCPSGTTCRPNYCGGCNFDCLSCPSTGGGICVLACQNNTDCSNGQICCSNGCGRVCMDGSKLLAKVDPD